MKYEDVSNSVVLDARLERHEVFDGASLRSRPTPMIVTAIGFFMIVLDTIVNVALPTIQKDLGGGISGMQWVSGGYADVFASFLLTGGALRRAQGLSVGALAIFMAGSGFCGLARALIDLNIVRLLQGYRSSANGMHDSRSKNVCKAVSKT